jgi:hypothetical protein
MKARVSPLLREGLEQLASHLPRGWRMAFSHAPRPEPRAQAYVRLVSPDGTVATLAMDSRSRFEPRDVVPLMEKLGGRREVVMVIAPFLSAETRARLLQASAAYLDVTGNVHLVHPVLTLDKKGAQQPPSPGERTGPTLRGPKAGAFVRALVDFRDTGTVRETAERAGLDVGYASRLVASLEEAGLVTRGKRGHFDKVDWAGLLRRWAKEAPLPTRAELARAYEPRGLAHFLDRLVPSGFLHAITGPLAACQRVPGAAPDSVFLYVHDVPGALEQFHLQPLQPNTPANVVLLRPEDILVFARARSHKGLSFATDAQVAADLLSSPSGAPQGETLLAWMAGHEASWRR